MQSKKQHNSRPRATSTRSNPTQRQIARLYTLAGQAGLNHEDIIGQLRAAYGIESTKRLTLAQYEEIVAWLKGRLGARRIGDGAPALSEGQLWRRAQVARLLDQECPEMETMLHDKLIDVLDDFRLYRMTGRISISVLRSIIQKMTRHPAAILEQACDIWLSHYRERSEEYFFGIMRRLRRDDRRQEHKQKREREAIQRERAAAQDKLIRDLESTGWQRIGHLPTGEPVFEFPSAFIPMFCLIRGNLRLPLRQDQRDQIIPETIN